MPRLNDLSWPAWLLILAVLAGTVMLAALGAEVLVDSLEVVEKGQLLPYTNGKIYRFRLFDRWDVFVEPERKPSKDLFGAYLLVGVAFISLTYGVLLMRRARPLTDRRRRLGFYFTLFTGATYLAADETLGIHETIGHNLQWLTYLPAVERPDDAVIVAYALPVVAFCWFFRKYLLFSPPAKMLFAAAAVAFGFVAIGDVFALGFEEYLEIVAALFLIAGVLILGADLTTADSRADDQVV